MSDEKLTGLALLDAAIEQIETHPETWYQGAYRCGSGMCVAGWMAEIHGGKWLKEDPRNPLSDLLEEPEGWDRGRERVWAFEYEDGGWDYTHNYAYAVRYGQNVRPAVTAYDYAEWALGRDPRGLFGGGNTLADIHWWREALGGAEDND